MTDTDLMPVVGTEVLFTLSTPPVGTTTTPSAVTDSNGLAVAGVSAGPAIGTFDVHATASSTVSVDSPTLRVVGAKPSNQAFVLQCATTNLAAYAAPVPPLAMTIPCTVSVADRFYNPISTGASVALHSETGLVPQSTLLSTDAGAFGTGTFLFNTVGAFPPVNVAPLAADPAQPFPGARDAEPSDGGANPRDGLVTVIATIQGEEWFDDVNANGVHDNGEPFIDQGEPFVDANDDGVQSPGELYVDSNANFAWDGPNGIWDGNTTIWTETTLLYTGEAALALGSFTPPDYGTCPSGVAKGSSTTLTLLAPDARMNVVEAGSVITVAHTADAGTVTMPPLLDGYGFGTQRVLLNGNGGQCTLGTDPVCTWKRVFTSWGQGRLPDIRIDGAPAGSPNACIDDTLTVSLTTGGALRQFSTTGAIQ